MNFFSASLVSVLFLYYYLAIEADITCLALDSSNQPMNNYSSSNENQSYTDVSYHFKILIILYICCDIFDFFRCLSTIVFVTAKINFFGKMTSILSLSIIIRLAVVIINHVYRLQHSGLVCSGHYRDSSVDGEIQNIQYLTRRGNLLYGFLILYWTLASLLIAIFIVAELRKKFCPAKLVISLTNSELRSSANNKTGLSFDYNKHNNSSDSDMLL